jgi:hypothetical protein
MTIIEAAQNIVNTQSAHLVRPNKNDPIKYDMKLVGTGNNKGWVILDLFTASVIVNVYSQINRKHQKMLEVAPIHRVVSACLSCIGTTTDDTF